MLTGSYGLAPPDLTGLLEPDAGRLARPVPRGAGHRKVSGLPDGLSREVAILLPRGAVVRSRGYCFQSKESPAGSAAAVAKHNPAPTFSGEQSNRQLSAGASRRTRQ